MLMQDIYKLWLNYKTKRRLITERNIKGKCELKARHWKLLERFWFGEFSKQYPESSFRNFFVFVRHHPSARVDANFLLKVMKSSLTR